MHCFMNLSCLYFDFIFLFVFLILSHIYMLSNIFVNGNHLFVGRLLRVQLGQDMLIHGIVAPWVKLKTISIRKLFQFFFLVFQRDFLKQVPQTLHRLPPHLPLQIQSGNFSNRHVRILQISGQLHER